MRLLKPRRPTNYQEQTYASPYAIVRYPHRKRIEMGVRSATDGHPRAILDYGAGDGKVLIDALRAGLPADTLVVAHEPVEYYANQIRAGAEASGFADRIDVEPDRTMLHGRSFDRILCLGVLEHMPLPERIAFYDLCDDVLNRDGRIIVDVPVEVGPTLLVKAVARRTIKGRSKEWSVGELVRAALGASVFDPARFDPTNSATWIQDHLGFDYRLLRREMGARFELVSQAATPIGLLAAPLGNQEMFLSFKRA